MNVLVGRCGFETLEVTYNSLSAIKKNKPILKMEQTYLTTSSTLLVINPHTEPFVIVEGQRNYFM